MMSNKINTKYILKNINDAGDQTAEWVGDIQGRLWQSREELSRTLITLTSAILIGTITFSGSLLKTNGVQPVAPVLLFMSWTFFLFSILLGIISLWKSITLYSFRTRFINATPDIEKAVEMLNPDDKPEDLMKQIGEVVREKILEAYEPLAVAHKIADNLVISQMVLFCIGLAGFLLFGIYQMK